MSKGLALAVVLIFVLLSVEVFSPLANGSHDLNSNIDQINTVNSKLKTRSAQILTSPTMPKNMQVAASFDCEKQAMPVDAVEDLPVKISLSLANRNYITKEATIVASITAQIDIKEVNVRLLLPDALTSTGAINATVELYSGITKQLEFPIKTVSTSDCNVQVVVTSTSLGNLKVASQSMLISTSSMRAANSLKDNGAQDQLAIQANSSSPQTTDIGNPGALTVYGYWYYYDESNNQLPIRFARVELWTSSNVKLNTTYTQSNGYYQFSPVENIAGGYNIFVRVYCDGDLEAYVTTSGGSTYTWITSTFNNVPDGNYNVGGYVASGTNRGCFGLYDAIIDEYYWLYNKVSWSRSEVQVRWPCEDWPHSHGNRMDIPTGSEWETLTTYHEYAHCIHYATRGGSFPVLDGPDPHYVDSESSVGFALTEGWAEFMQCAVSNNIYGLDPSGSISIESTLLADGVPPPYVSHGDVGDWDGSIVEGAIANLFWDMSDGISIADHPSFSTKGDNVNNQFIQLWNIFKTYQPNGIATIWSYWTPKDNDIWTVCFNNRVGVADIYEPDNSFSQYSSTALSPFVLQSQNRSIEPANDYDYIRFYAEPGNYTFYTSSTIDTVGYLYASNQTMLATDDDSGGNNQFKINYQITSGGYYFLRINCFYSTVNGPYDLYVSYIPASSNVPLPPVLVSPPDGAIIVPQNATFTWMVSTSATNYQMQINGVNTSEYNTFSTSCVVSILPSGSYTWRVRAYNTSGWGNWGSTRSFTYIASAPTGLIVINEGAEYTNSTSVTLMLSAADDFGIAQMRFSNNTSTWSAWQPYATSKAWNISSGDGVKTVYAQFASTLGVISQVYSDTITLDTVLPTANGGSSSRTGTQGSSVTFDASGSSDNIGVASYLWNFGDGQTGTAATTSHTYSTPGTYTVLLTIVDSAGNIARTTISITINPAPTPTPNQGGGGGNSGGSNSNSVPNTNTPTPPTPTPTPTPTPQITTHPPTSPTASPQTGPALDIMMIIGIIVAVAVISTVAAAAKAVSGRKNKLPPPPPDYE